MSDAYTALQAAIEAGPTDLLARLALADWFTDEGNPEQGEWNRHHTTVDGCHRILDIDPVDWIARRCLAVRLDNSGRHTEAACQQWMVREEKCPLHGYLNDPGRWDWFSAVMTLSQMHALGIQIAGFLRGIRGNQIGVYNSRQEAEADLCQALVTLKIV